MPSLDVASLENAVGLGAPLNTVPALSRYSCWKNWRLLKSELPPQSPGFQPPEMKEQPRPSQCEESHSRIHRGCDSDIQFAECLQQKESIQVIC